MENSMEYEDIKKEIENLLDQQARTLVGILCKRIEVLDEQKVLKPDLYKALAKEHIYENFRQTKKLLNTKLGIGRINFISDNKE